LTRDLSEKEGCTVLAGCFTEKGISEWNGKKNVIPFMLDITKQESIENAVKIVNTHAPQGIWALVNNAGTIQGAIFELTTVSAYRSLMEINFIGHVALTEKLLPFIKKSRGRIVNMSSVYGTIPAPGTSAYCATKYAMYAWSMCIRRELSPYGISVSVVCPGYMKTPLTTAENLIKSFENCLKDLPKEKLVEFDNYVKMRPKILAAAAATIMENPQQVVDAYTHAILAQYPKSKYLAGKSAYSLNRQFNYYPEWLLDKMYTVKGLPTGF